MEEPHKRLSLVPSPEGRSDGAPFASHTDDELMLLARGGVRLAFDALVRRHQTRALHVAARRLGSDAAAADAAQNTFLEIYRALPRYQPRGIFPSYLYQSSSINATPPGDRGGSTTAPSAGRSPPNRPPRPRSSRERQRDVDAAVARLRDKLRDVVLLRYSAGLSYEQIAVTLEIPTGTVKRRLFDAMERLRQSLEER